VEVIFKRHSNLTLLSAIDGELGLNWRATIARAILLDIPCRAWTAMRIEVNCKPIQLRATSRVIALSADAMQSISKKVSRLGRGIPNQAAECWRN